MRRAGGTQAGAGAGIVAALLLAGCDTAPAPPLVYDATAHEARVQEWRQWRHGQLVRPDGWLSLTGLYWLPEGESTLGNAGADLAYAREGVPELIGTFVVEGAGARFVPAPGVPVRVGEETIQEVVAFADAEDFEAPVMQLGALRWHVMRRDEQLAVRLKDAESPVLTSFTAMDNFAIDARWWLSGRFEPYDPPRVIKIPNILGTIGEKESEGAAVFEVEGQTYRIDLWRDSDDPENFFTAFGDASNADTTYGAGRFLWIDAPDEHGRLAIDFNRSYNPPCAFTPFATCPLPPAQNRLPIPIEAGERDFKPGF